MKINKIINKAIETALIISLIGMILSVIIQVFTRFFMESAPAWTEEAGRIFFFYAVVFGAGLGIRDGAFVYLDYFIEKLNAHIKFKIQILIRFSVIMFGFILFIFSIKFVLLGIGETSPALEISMSYIFLGLPILGALIVYFGIFELLNFYRLNKL